MRILFLSALLFLFSCSASTQKIDPASFDTILNKVYKPTGPGATAIVTRKGEVIYKKAFGMADLELNVPMQTDMIFRLGSITKQFTAVAILQLAEQGKLSLQDDIKKFIPDYPTQGKTITIEHLLTHTSGIKSYTNMDAFGTMMRKDMKPLEIIDVSKNEPMEFDPGTNWNYNNTGYIILGYIIEKISGKTYEQYVKDNLFTPAGMSHSSYGNEIRIIKNRARGYTGSEKGYENADYLSMTLPYAAGSLLSTVEDLSKWNQALHSYKIISKPWLDKAFTNYKLSNGKLSNYGYGFFFANVQGSPTIEHSGGINGFQTDAIYMPKEDVFVAIFSNCNCNPPRDMTQRMAAIAIGKPYSFKEIGLSEAAAKEYVGVYETEEGEQRTIRLEGTQLTSQRGNANKLTIKPFEKDKFFFEGSLSVLEFIRNSSGKIEKLNSISHTEEREWKKTDKTPPASTTEIKVDNSTLDSYVGEYQLAPSFIITITHEGDKLMAQATAQPQFELFAESATKFFLKVVEAKIEFFKGADNKITHLVLYQNGQTVEGKKIK